MYQEKVQFHPLYFVFLSTIVVCEFTLQIKSKQTEKCNCAFSACFQCEVNTNISLSSKAVKNWSLKTQSMLVLHCLEPMLHSSLLPFKLNFNSEKGKMGKEKKEISESNKHVGNTHRNLSLYILLQNIKYQLHFMFFSLSTGDEVQKLICMFV